MTNTIHEQIAQKIQTAISAVDGLTCIRRTRRKQRQPVTDGLVILYQGDPHPAEDPPHGWTQWEAVFVAQVCSVLDDDDTTAVDTQLNNYRGEIEAAAMADPQWDGLAINTSIGAPMTPEPEEAYDLIQVVIRVQFRHLIGDPFSQS